MMEGLDKYILFCLMGESIPKNVSQILKHDRLHLFVELDFIFFLDKCMFAFFFLSNYHQVVPTAQIPLTFSLTIHPNWPSFLVGPLDSIQCLHRADECKFFASWPTLVHPYVVVNIVVHGFVLT